MATVTYLPVARPDADPAEGDAAAAEPAPAVLPARRRVRPSAPATKRGLRSAPAPERGLRSPGAGSSGGGPRPVRCGRSYDGGIHGGRLTVRGRVVVALVWVVLLGAAALLITRPVAAPVPERTTTVTVEPGDTLWRFATELTPEADPRTTVGQIVELNDLRSVGDIHPGQVLVVPAEG